MATSAARDTCSREMRAGVVANGTAHTRTLYAEFFALLRKWRDDGEMQGLDRRR